MITVSKSGTGDFTSIQEAIDHALPGDTISIAPGIYKEVVTVKTPHLTIIGSNTDFNAEYLRSRISSNESELCDSGTSCCAANESANVFLSSDNTIISYGNYAKMPSSDIGKLGTFRTYTMIIDADDVTLKNMTIENSAGAGPDIGQAIALYADGDKLRFENIRLLGWQDTLFTGPLPPKEIEKNGFIGPKQFSPRINGHQYYNNCYIEGDIDFIFGSATAYFEKCVIFQKNREAFLYRKHSYTSYCGSDTTIVSSDKSFSQKDLNSIFDSDETRVIKSYVTASSTPEGQDYGYVFDDCHFDSDCPDGTCYLGRPWRNYASVVIMNSFIGSQINKEGFHNWNKKDAESTVRFYEYRNYGPGASFSNKPNVNAAYDATEEDLHQSRARFVKELTDTEACMFSKEKVIS
ncbi:pectinesterase family protein [Oribacterium sp. WCC10]|uniref:pectinesterase family protein n=1 Tax=Oribacterium sp. WCC10 TaxID=1855343 RepID=UPI0008F0BAEE|nr:pectinesterase family protein [Oribacterium sp. WCC10]SFG53820.1 pectinesterase [Oribacterium sp. WCC10]